jgi:hypothetical protein
MFTSRHRIRRDRRLDEFQAPLGQTLGVVAEETWARSPLSSIARSRELFEAEYGAGGLGNLITTGDLWSEPDSPMVSAEDARRRIGEEGVDLSVPDSGIRRRALDILIDRKKLERRRQDVLSRSPGGFGAGSLKLATALGVSLLDPINIAASFVPVIGPARYSAMLARAGGAIGRAGVRARVGVVEGVTGQALVEPLVYGAARQEQADYGLADSFINVAFGGVMGGGLHVGAGAVTDAVRRGRPLQLAKPDNDQGMAIESLPHEARTALLRASVAQAIEGRVTRIDGLLDHLKRSAARGGDRPLPGTQSRAAEGSEPMPAPMAAPQVADQGLRAGQDAALDLDPTRPANAALETRSGADQTLAGIDYDLRRIAETGQGIDALMRAASPEAAARAVQVQEIASLVDRVAELEQLPPTRNAYGPGLRRNDAVPEDADVFEFGISAITEAERARELASARDRLGSLQGAVERGEIDGRILEAVRFGRALDEAPPALSADRLRDDARASLEPGSLRLSDIEAAERTDAQLKQMSGDELQRLQSEAEQAIADLADASRVLGREDDTVAAMAQVQGLDAQAAEYGRAVLAAANCSLRRGV